jgi:hypothetical protein
MRYKDLLRPFISLMNGNGLFPNEKDEVVNRVISENKKGIDNYMDLLQWVVYLEHVYNANHPDGPLDQEFEKMWRGDANPYMEEPR